MKKIVLGAVMMFGWSVSANATMSYECWAYKSAKPQWMTYVSANNQSEAESLAWSKFTNELGRNPDYIKCK